MPFLAKEAEEVVVIVDVVVHDWGDSGDAIPADVAPPVGRVRDAVAVVVILIGSDVTVEALPPQVILCGNYKRI